MKTGTSSDPCSSIYHGPEPFSESETRAIRDYIKGLQGAVKLYLSFHSYGNVNSVGGCSTDYMKEHEGINLAFVTEMTKTKWGFFLPTELILPVISKYYNAVKVFAKALL
ncbi:Carboxypeptidase B [Blattella germanica]|nr:Carboxypeptidase B [Blattella germanica]